MDLGLGLASFRNYRKIPAAKCVIRGRSTGLDLLLAVLTRWKQVDAGYVAQAVKEFGANKLVVSTDLGQSANMVHPDGVEVAIDAMKREGISDADIDMMMRENPARLLGLTP